MLDMDRPQAIDPEDREIMAKLAKLQSMYNQVSCQPRTPQHESCMLLFARRLRLICDRLAVCGPYCQKS